MLHKIKTSLLQITALTLLATFGFSGVVAAQSTGPNPQGAICKGAKDLQVSSANADPSTECAGGTDDPANKVNTLITQIINVFSVVVGIVAVIMIIIGGFKYITSGGDSGNVTGAKNTILYAIIGLIIVALAQFIVRFVLSKTAETAAPGA
jgi:cytochrome bd-type quinol oxidase subunit 2